MVIAAPTTHDIQSIQFPVADLALEVTTRHARGYPCVVFAHGFGQTSGAWNGAAEALARDGCRTVTFDSRGHGQSGRLADGDYHLEQFADDMLQLARVQPERPILVGASMGGLLGLLLAGEVRPAPFSALVLVDITPRWEPAGVERILTFMQASPDGFADYAEAAAKIAAYLPQRAQEKSERRLRSLLQLGADGRLRWHWDPALLEAVARDGERYQGRLQAAASSIEVPVLLLSGARSDVVSNATIDEFMALVPHARHVEIPHATHMLAGDANDAFIDAVSRFVQSIAGADRASADAVQSQ